MNPELQMVLVGHRHDEALRQRVRRRLDEDHSFATRLMQNVGADLELVLIEDEW